MSVPAAILPVLRDHLAAFVDDNPEALVFTTPSGRPIWRGNLNKVIGWSGAIGKLGVPGLHFHALWEFEQYPTLQALWASAPLRSAVDLEQSC